MTGAVAVGMFRDIRVGPVIVTAHYISAIMVGLILGVFGRGRDISTPLEGTRGSIIVRAFRAMSQARRRDGRPLGKIMGDAVRESVNSLLLIGGFIILFSVVVKILEMVGVVGAVSSIFTLALKPLGWHQSTVPALTSGLFEITMGTQAASQAPAPLVARVMAASAVIAWSGLSVHAQVSAVTQGTDIRMGVYVIARALHAVLAAVCTLFLMGPAQAVMARIAPAAAPAAAGAPLVRWAMKIQYFGARFALFSIGLVVLALLLLIMRLPRITFAWKGRPPRRR
ncbi:MAG: nucleoside recognition domain-containing protein [Ignavibacteriales bacterium]